VALLAIQALTGAGRQPGKEVIVVSVDGERAGLEAVDRGELGATVEALLRVRKAEKAMRARSELLRVTLESIGDVVVATDAEGIVTFINPLAQQLTGWTDEAVGKPLNDVFRIVNEETGAAANNPVERVIRTGRTHFPRHLINVPLKSTRGVLGAIVLQGLPHNERARRLLLALAELAATAIEKMRLLDESRLRAQQLETLRQAAETLAAQLDQETLFSHVLSILEHDFGCLGAIFLLDALTG